MDLLDTEPLFGDRESESTVGEAFRSGYPDSVMVATKCILGATPPEVRFRGSGLDEHPVGWEQRILDATGQRATISTVGEVHAGLGWMIAADLFRPCYEFLYRFSSSTMLEHARRLRDPNGFARLGVLCESNPRLHRLDRSHSFNQLARTLIHNGGRLADITVADCVEAYRAQVGYTARQQSFYVAAELMAQCRTSVAYRYNEPVNPASDIPTFRGPRSQMRNLAELAQALKWVFCYRYQSCEDPGWPTTFAYHYTERLRVELENRIINCYATTWDYDGGPLTI